MTSTDPDTLDQAGPALEAAIERYAAAEAGHPVIVTGWMVIARVTDPELNDAVVMERVTPPYQDIVTDLGLSRYAALHTDRNAITTAEDS